MKRRGVIGLSFGMIFSILMIIAIVAIAAYAIIYFLNLGKISEISLFHQKFQETVDEVWGSSITNKIVSFTLPGEIERVCFGNLSAQTRDQRYDKEYKDFKRYSSNFEKKTTNRFIYPTNEAGDFTYKKIDKIDLSGLDSNFECFEVVNRKIRVRFEKDTFDALVIIGKP
jgi:hypothetical protein